MNTDFPLESAIEVIWMLLNPILIALKWSIENSGTVGMFVLTIFVVVYTRKTLKATQKTVELSEKTLKEANRPDIVAYCDIVGDYQLYFFIKNLGSSLAVNIKVDLEILRGDLKNKTFLKADMINNEISMLVPGQYLRTMIERLAFLIDENENLPKFNVNVSYKDSYGELFKDFYVLDMNMYKGNEHIPINGVHELTKEVRLIRKNLTEQ